MMVRHSGEVNRQHGLTLYGTAGSLESLMVQFYSPVGAIDGKVGQVKCLVLLGPVNPYASYNIACLTK